MRMLHRFHLPPYLEQVMKFISSHFSSSVSSEAYRATAVSSVVNQELSVEKVQALLLLAIVLHSRNERAEAGACLDCAMDSAYELGMHRGNFAEAMGGTDPTRVETLRRTWWELFVIEGMLTAVGVRERFTASMIPLEVPLPCEERIYNEGLCLPPPSTIAQFDDRPFADDEISFSSFAYRIEAVRILGRVVLLGQMTQSHQEQIEAIDAKIASWFHHLPEAKAELMRPDGTADEMMFQAIMIVNGASIYLHFPRSDLLSSPALAAEVICGQPGQFLPPAFSHRAHAMRALKAASELSALAAMRIPVTKHTPFFICALVLSSMVQLAAYSAKAGQMPDPRRDRLALTVGVFKSLGRIWAISHFVMQQIKAVARDVMDIGIRPTADSNPFDFAAFLAGSQHCLPETPKSCNYEV
jgi:Fungal specific transcription factor domain